MGPSTVTLSADEQFDPSLVRMTLQSSLPLDQADSPPQEDLSVRVTITFTSVFVLIDKYRVGPRCLTRLIGTVILSVEEAEMIQGYKDGTGTKPCSPRGI